MKEVWGLCDLLLIAKSVHNDSKTEWGIWAVLQCHLLLRCSCWVQLSAAASFLFSRGMRNLNQDAKPRLAASLSTFQEPAIRALYSGHAVFHPAQPLGQTALTTDQWSSDRIPQQDLLDFTIQPRLAENGIPGLTLQHYFQEMPHQ